MPLNLVAVITVTLGFCVCKGALLNVKEDLRGLFSGLTKKCERYFFSFRKYLIGKNGSSSACEPVVVNSHVVLLLYG